MTETCTEALSLPGGVRASAGEGGGLVIEVRRRKPWALGAPVVGGGLCAFYAGFVAFLQSPGSMVPLWFALLLPSPLGLAGLAVIALGLRSLFARERIEAGPRGVRPGDTRRLAKDGRKLLDAEGWIARAEILGVEPESASVGGPRRSRLEHRVLLHPTKGRRSPTLLGDLDSRAQAEGIATLLRRALGLAAPPGSA